MSHMNLALLSCWNHYHTRGFVRDLATVEQARIIALWDEDASRGTVFAEEFGTVFEPSLETLLARTDIDGVIIDCKPEHAASLTIAAARSGKSIIADQVLAMTSTEAEQAAQAIREAGVRYALDMSLKRWPVNRAAKIAVESGLLGDIRSIRVRNAHAGAISPGWPEHFRASDYGVFSDLGVHCLYLTGWLLGTPNLVTAMTSHTTADIAEDNAACIMQYERGTLAICDSSHVTKYSPYSIEIYGTQGSFHGGGVNGVHRKLIRPEDAVISMYTDTTVDGRSPIPISAVYEPSICQWVQTLQGVPSVGGAALSGVEEGIQLARLLEALYVSARDGRAVAIR